MSHKSAPPVTRREALCRIGNGLNGSNFFARQIRVGWFGREQGKSFGQQAVTGKNRKAVAEDVLQSELVQVDVADVAMAVAVAARARHQRVSPVGVVEIADRFGDEMAPPHHTVTVDGEGLGGVDVGRVSAAVFAAAVAHSMPGLYWPVASSARSNCA